MGRKKRRSSFRSAAIAPDIKRWHAERRPIYESGKKTYGHENNPANPGTCLWCGARMYVLAYPPIRCLPERERPVREP